MAEDEARLRVKANAVQRAAVEAVDNIRSIEEAERRNRERAESEARAKDEAKIK